MVNSWLPSGRVFTLTTEGQCLNHSCLISKKSHWWTSGRTFTPTAEGQCLNRCCLISK